MAATTSFGATAATSLNKNAPNSSSYLPLCHSHSYSTSKLSFRLSRKPNLRFLSRGVRSTSNRFRVVRAQLNKVSVDGSSSSVKSEVSSSDTKDVKPSTETSPVASEESISEFITQVANLVKLVDSRDIVELELKHLDCEVLIRKKEALPPPPSPPVMMTQPQTYQSVSPHPSAAPPAPAPSPAALPAPAPAASSAPKSSKSSLPPLKCPMAGTFYRSPAPSEPPFVKVGDKVKKGQVLCIIEAMKLMNEIEADQSGTIVEVIAEDGKPVSVDTPLFVIEP